MKIFAILFFVIAGGFPFYQQFAHRNNVLSYSSLGKSLQWKKIPIEFKIDDSVPADAQFVFQREVQKLNKMAGMTIVTISKKKNLSPDLSKNSENLISWGEVVPNQFLEKEIATTKLFYDGENFNLHISEADIHFNPKALSFMNLATVFRHELSHALGIRHLDHGLMANHIPDLKEIGWEQTVVNQWKKEMNLQERNVASEPK